MRKILLAAIGAMSIAFAAAPFATTTHVARSASAIQVEVAGGYHQARVLQPGSRGNVVEI